MPQENRRSDPGRLLLDSMFRDNPAFTMVLGICASLIVTNSAKTALMMGICTTVILLLSGVVLSALKRVISSSVRIPCAVLLVATFVAVTEYLLKAYVPSAAAALAFYLPLVAVNCLVLGQAESFAFRNSISRTAVAAFGTGFGYTLALTLIGMARELIGSGTVFGRVVTQGKVPQMDFFAMAPGGLFLLGLLCAAIKKLTMERERDEVRIEKAEEVFVYSGAPDKEENEGADAGTEEEGGSAE